MARHLTKHAVTLALHAGLDRADNGDLIKAAEDRGFEVLVTPDRNLGYQRNLKGRKLAIVVLPSGRWPGVQDQLQEVVDTIDKAVLGSYCEIPFRRVKLPGQST